MRRIQQIYTKVKSVRHPDIFLTAGFLAAVAIIYAFISVNTHNRFMTFGLDLGYFDEAIWKIGRGKFPYSGVGCIWLLEDHFQIILYLLAPLYRLWDDVRVILVFQAMVMVFAGLPLYLLARRITKSIIFSFSTVFAYLFFIGTQFAILNEFHQITIAPLFIALLFYALVNKSRRLYLASLVMLVIIKEDLSLLVGAIGLGLLFTGDYRKRGFFTALFGFVLFFFLTYKLMPSISIKGAYAHFDFGEAGYTPLDIIRKTLADPFFFLRAMVYPDIKLQTVFRSLFSFGFLPLFAPLALLIPLLENFVTRFIYSGGQFTVWGLVNHHAAVSSMLLAVSAVYGARKLGKNVNWRILGIIIIAFTITGDIVYHGPVNSVFKPVFYLEEQWVRDNREVISKVPPNASVAAQNNLLPHLTHRDNIYRIPYGLNSEYMVVDLHDGPNKYAPLSYSEMKDFVQSLLTTKRYAVVYQKGKAMLLHRNFKTDITKSKYYGNSSHCYYSYEER